ncbi:methionine domain-containing protein [Desulfonema limicola]|uniref:Methionine domain-containing protein n=1 Tax=Desulfonema limicola TaxID=45656 RepID=A0A975B6K6_9BACT|nr:hypothetical protein [Desulfonema limicola]QTA79577.1 methionine domain-containing protein [Desulfonema limicola]
MNIMTDISISITSEEVIQSMTLGKRDNSWMRQEIDKAVQIAQNLWNPAIVYAWADVKEISGQSLTLVNHNNSKSVILHIGPHVNLMIKAQKAFISVNTIGEELDRHVKELNRRNDRIGAFLLDSAGVVALSKVGDAASRIAEKQAIDRGWGTGARLSPGSLTGWPIEDQHPLCSLLLLKNSGIRLNEHNILIPFKSASGMIGIGPEYREQKVSSVCRLCIHKNTCWRSTELVCGDLNQD